MSWPQGRLQGGDATAELIRTRFGDRVADLVLHCTDSASADPAQKRPWQARKDAYLERLAHADHPAALITAADKLHNITATIRDVRAHGPQTLARFNAPDRVLWYYRAVADALEPHAGFVPLAELRAATDELARLVERALAGDTAVSA